MLETLQRQELIYSMTWRQAAPETHSSKITLLHSYLCADII